MTPVFFLARHSVVARRFSVGLMVLAIALSVTMLLGIERLRTDLRSSFAQTIAGTDLVVGARSGPIQLLLYSVFHVGDAVNNMRWQSVQQIMQNPAVAWVVPLSLGDSHRGFRVVGTTDSYFTHYRYGRKKSLTFAQGKPFDAVFDAVIGAEVAEQLGYQLGQSLVLTHGVTPSRHALHDDKPFYVSGILHRTGTPVDRSILVSLEAIEAIHLDWVGGARMPGVSIPASQVKRFDLTPKYVTATLIGLHRRIDIFKVQRAINAFTTEPLQAVMPGVTLQQLWQSLGFVEKALNAISALVVFVGLTGLVAVVMAGLAERRRELAILRSMGARPSHIFWLLSCESMLVAVGGIVLGVGLLYVLIVAVSPLLEGHYGLRLQLELLNATQWWLLVGVLVASWLASIAPAVRAYRYSVADGMTPQA